MGDTEAMRLLGSYRLLAAIWREARVCWPPSKHSCLGYRAACSRELPMSAGINDGRMMKSHGCRCGDTRGRCMGASAVRHLDAFTAGEVALGQVVRSPGTCPGPAGQFSGSPLGAHAGR
jgi:hypothetical protein